MKFVDSCEVDVAAGKGGNGAIAFRREKFVPFGGPSGGDGGRGGDVVFVADEGLSTLLDLAYGRTLRAPHGEQGHGKDMYGRGGEDLVVRVPVGTQVRDRETGELLFDIDRADARVIVAKGGKGGRGNIHFATPYDRAPRRAEPGEPGEERRLRLELKVMADVGLLGFPNVGKSTFIRAVSRARPKVADYPFTTLTPHLGVVRIGDEATMVIADIPGLIPGASEGAGLGHRFLKHVERTRALLHLVTLDFDEAREPLEDYDALMTELERFEPELAKRPQLVAMSKADLPDVREAYEGLRARFAERGIELHLISAVTGEGVRELSVALYKLATGQSEIEDWSTPADAGQPHAGAPRATRSVPAEAESATARTAKNAAATRLAAKMAPATMKKASATTKKASATTKKAAATAKKAAATAKKASATTKKASATTKKAAATTKKAAAAAKKAPAAAKKLPVIAKKAAATTKKAAATAKMAGATTKKATATTKKAAATAKKAAAKKTPVTKKAPATTKKAAASAKKTATSTKKATAKKAPASAKKTAATARKAPATTKKAGATAKKSAANRAASSGKRGLAKNPATSRAPSARAAVPAKGATKPLAAKKKSATRVKPGPNKAPTKAPRRTVPASGPSSARAKKSSAGKPRATR